MFIDEIFEEIFGTDFLDRFESAREKFNKHCENNDDNDSSYYHRITEEYENGKCVARSEKEVKDGKVIKDVAEVNKLENKTCDENKCCTKKSYDYEEKCKEYESVIKNLESELREKENRIEYLERKLETFKNNISSLLK